MIIVDGLIDVGQCLGLNPLGGVDNQQGALTGGQRTAHLIGKVNMARRIHQIERIGLSVVRLIFQRNGLSLDGDAAFLLDIHAIEHPVRASRAR